MTMPTNLPLLLKKWHNVTTAWKAGTHHSCLLLLFFLCQVPMGYAFHHRSGSTGRCTEHLQQGCPRGSLSWGFLYLQVLIGSYSNIYHHNGVALFQSQQDQQQVTNITVIIVQCWEAGTNCPEIGLRPKTKKQHC